MLPNYTPEQRIPLGETDVTQKLEPSRLGGTVQDMTARSAGSSLWIRRFHPDSQSKIRLVCFPHAGGSASFYFSVSRALQGDVEVLAVQYPGREDRRAEPCATSIAELADCVFEALRHMSGPPLALFGHSMGAVIAFEVAQRLEREMATAAVRLFVSGRRAPSRHHEEYVHLQDDQEILTEIKTLNGTDARVLGDEEIMRMSLPSLRGDYRAIESYRGGEDAQVSCPISMLLGNSDPRVTVDDALAWCTHTTAGFDSHILSGGHFYLGTQQSQVVELIRDRLVASQLSEAGRPVKQDCVWSV